ncbi:MAG: PepSY domain-containing protein [Gammaproteobacteria bacterium]
MTQAQAQELIDRRQQRREQRVADVVSLDEAVQMAQSRYRAKAVRAETVVSGGRRVHRIRLLSPEGKVWMVRVDAQTGAMH